MISAVSKVRYGDSLTLCADNVLCGGGALYTAFRPMPERVPVFVSEVEHYKKTKENYGRRCFLGMLDPSALKRRINK